MFYDAQGGDEMRQTMENVFLFFLNIIFYDLMR